MRKRHNFPPSFRISYRAYYARMAIAALVAALVTAYGMHQWVKQLERKLEVREHQVRVYRASLTHCSKERIFYEASNRRLGTILHGQEVLIRFYVTKFNYPEGL